jgi:hypothetical protein
LLYAFNAGETATITLTAFVSGGGPASAAAHIAANPAPPPAPINTLDTILILRLEDGADSFISCHGSLLPSCFGMDLDALLTLGDSPVLSSQELEQGQGRGQQLLQQGLARLQLPLAAEGLQQGEDEGDLLGLQEQLQLGEAAAAAGGHSSAAGAGAGAGADKERLVTGLEERVPKEVQRLVNFLQVGWGQPFSISDDTRLLSYSALHFLVTAHLLTPVHCTHSTCCSVYGCTYQCHLG